MLCKISQYFPKPYIPSGGNVIVELDLSYYTTKAVLKEATGINAPNLATKPDLELNTTLINQV